MKQKRSYDLITDCTTIGQTTLIDGYPENATVELTSFISSSGSIDLTEIVSELSGINTLVGSGL